MLKTYRNEKWIATLIPEGLRVLPDTARCVVTRADDRDAVLEWAELTKGGWSVGERRHEPIFDVDAGEVFQYWRVEPNLGEANMDGVSNDELRKAEYIARAALRAAAK